MSDWDPQNIWEGLHKGSPFLRPAKVVKARLHSTFHQDDGKGPLDPDVVPAMYVSYDNNRQHWYVKFRNPRGGPLARCTMSATTCTWKTPRDITLSTPLINMRGPVTDILRATTEVYTYRLLWDKLEERKQDEV